MNHFINYTYQNGTSVCLGDRVRVHRNNNDFAMATVTIIAQPNSEEALTQIGVEDGGVFLEFDSGDCWLVDEMDEDFELISRQLPPLV